MKKPLSKLTRQLFSMHFRLSFGQKQHKLKARQTSLCNPPLRQVKEQNEIMRPTYHTPKAMQGLQYFHAKTKLGPCKIKRGRNLSCTLTAHTLTMHLGQISCKPNHVNYAKKKQKPTQWSLRHLSTKVPTHHAKTNLYKLCHLAMRALLQPMPLTKQTYANLRWDHSQIYSSCQTTHGSTHLHAHARESYHAKLW